MPRLLVGKLTAKMVNNLCIVGCTNYVGEANGSVSIGSRWLIEVEQQNGRQLCAGSLGNSTHEDFSLAIDNIDK